MASIQISSIPETEINLGQKIVELQQNAPLGCENITRFVQLIKQATKVLSVNIYSDNMSQIFVDKNCGNVSYELMLKEK